MSNIYSNEYCLNSSTPTPTPTPAPTATPPSTPVPQVCLSKLGTVIAPGTDGQSFYCAGPSNGSSPCCFHSRDILLVNLLTDDGTGVPGNIYGSSPDEICTGNACEQASGSCTSCCGIDITDIPSDLCICPPIPGRANPDGCTCLNAEYFYQATGIINSQCPPIIPTPPSGG